MDGLIEMNKGYILLLSGLVVLVACSAGRAESIAEGVRLTPLSNDGKSVALSWSYHGNRIAFVREVSDEQSQLLIMNADGTGEQAVSPVGNPFFAEWSWTGQKLSYAFSNANEEQSQGAVHVYDTKTNRSIQV
ncbi:MAG: TolB family protein, partial [Planctomycetota bacterium]